jgi:hypothetical protein
MPAGLSVAIALLALTASAAPASAAPVAPAPAPAATRTPVYGPVAPAPPKAPPKPPVKSADDGCAAVHASTSERAIVVCAQRPQGYRLNPDVIEARREIRSGGRPTPSEKFRNTDCATIGPMGCRGGAGINLVNAVMVAGTIAAKAMRGENVGQMFETDPSPSEYQLYLEAKRRREAKEAQAAKVRADQAAGQSAAAK